MENRRIRIPPRWMFSLLSIGAAWASGIYLGKLSVEGRLTGLLIPMVSFGVMAVIMALGVFIER
jgi:hypothetical protein